VKRPVAFQNGNEMLAKTVASDPDHLEGAAFVVMKRAAAPRGALTAPPAL
jgi:hypothetical protein